MFHRDPNANISTLLDNFWAYIQNNLPDSTVLLPIIDLADLGGGSILLWRPQPERPPAFCWGTYFVAEAAPPTDVEASLATAKNVGEQPAVGPEVRWEPTDTEGGDGAEITLSS